MGTELRRAVERARDTFLIYEKWHRAKLSSPGSRLSSQDREEIINKADRNRDLATEMQTALDSGPFDVLALEKVQDYRFGSLIKGENYAFARGLTISPTHLPAALDAMLSDGFELVCMFGDPQSDKMGLIFRIVGPDARVQGLLEANNREVERRRAAEALMREFVERVEAGEVRSKGTYTKFQEHLARYGD